MTKTTHERRTWLDSLKVGVEVAVMRVDDIECVGHIERCKRRELWVDCHGAFSPATGIELLHSTSPWIVRCRIEPITNEIRAKLRYADIYRSVMGQMSRGVPTNALELIELVLIWKNSPDVILAATERIHEVTRERMEAQR